jgi:mannosyltransferase
MRRAQPTRPDGVTHERCASGRWAIVALAAILIVALGLRLVALERAPLWWDEGNNAYFAHASLAELLRASRATLDTDPPTHRLALKVWLALWGSSPFHLRSFSALCGALTVWLTYVWGRWRYNVRVGLWAAALLALWPLAIYYSREGKGYPFATLFAWLSAYLWQRYLDGAPRLRFWPWLGAALSAALALGAHYYVALFMAAQGVGLAAALAIERASWRDARRRLGRWLTVNLAAAALVIPWFALTHATALLGAERLPAAQAPGSLLAYGRHLVAPLVTALAGPGWAMVLALAALGLAAGAALWRSRNRAAEALLLALVVAPLALGFGAQQRVAFVRPRFFLYILPPLALLAASGMAALRRGGVALALALAVAWGVTLPAAYHPHDQPQEDMRPLAAALREYARPGDVVIGSYIWQEGILRLLAPQATVSYHLGWFDEATVGAQIEALFEAHPRLWLLSYNTALQHPANPGGWWLEHYAARALLLSDPPHSLALYLPAPATQIAAAEAFAVFGEAIALESFALPATAQAGDALPLTLRWRVIRSPAAAPAVFAHLVSAEGRFVSQSDGPPQNGLASFATPSPAEGILDARALLLPADVPPGEYRLLLGLYDPASGQRLTVTQGEKAGADHVLLGQVRVKAGE